MHFCQITDVIFIISLFKKSMIFIFLFKLFDLFYFFVNKNIHILILIQSNSIYNSINITIIEY